MLGTLASEDEGDKASAREALLARLADSELLVIQALYEQPDVVVQALHSEYIAAVRPMFVDSSANAKIVHAHLGFVDEHLLPAHPELADQIFESLVFPILQTRVMAGSATVFTGGLAKLELVSSATFTAKGPEQNIQSLSGKSDVTTTRLRYAFWLT